MSSLICLYILGFWHKQQLVYLLNHIMPIYGACWPPSSICKLLYINKLMQKNRTIKKVNKIDQYILHIPFKYSVHACFIHQLLSWFVCHIILSYSVFLYYHNLECNKQKDIAITWKTPWNSLAYVVGLFYIVLRSLHATRIPYFIEKSKKKVYCGNLTSDLGLSICL